MPAKPFEEKRRMETRYRRAYQLVLHTEHSGLKHLLIHLRAILREVMLDQQTRDDIKQSVVRLTADMYTVQDRLYYTNQRLSPPPERFSREDEAMKANINLALALRLEGYNYANRVHPVEGQTVTGDNLPGLRRAAQ